MNSPPHIHCLRIFIIVLLHTQRKLLVQLIQMLQNVSMPVISGMFVILSDESHSVDLLYAWQILLLEQMQTMFDLQIHILFQTMSSLHDYN